MLWILLFLSGLVHSEIIHSEELSPSCLEKNQKLILENQLWNNEQWLALLHMHEGILSPKTEVDSPLFLLSPVSDQSPKQEMLSTVKAFCENAELRTIAPKIPTQRAHCMYPAREQFLESLGLGGWPKPECADKDLWKTRVGNQSVSLVFSSYYANNPSSVFGHSLLRFDKLQPGTENLMTPLLSYGINFAAEPTTTNGALYALMGMIGGFYGKFASLPYYYKVREYSDFDSRDLWEYKLDLTPKQVDMLLNHIWELGFTKYNYYYFTENCSYQLLAAVDAVVPERNLRDHVPWWVIPIDSVKAFTESPGFIKDISFRPSLYRQLNERLKRLEELNLLDSFYDFIDDQKPLPKDLSPEHRALLMDAILDHWDFKNIDDLLDTNSPASKQKAVYLSERASLPITVPLKFDIKDQERPDLSHSSARIGLSWGRQSDLKENVGIDMRFALHDLLDPQIGYPKNAAIEFFRFKGKYFNKEDKKELKLTEFKFFEVTLLSPLSRLIKTYSWTAVMGVERSYLGCNYCLAGRVLVQGGYTLGLFDDQFVTYAMAGGDVRTSPEQEDYLQAFPVATLGIKTSLPGDFHLNAQSDYLIGSLYALTSAFKTRVELRKNFGLSASIGLAHSSEHHEKEDVTFDTSDLSLYYFF